MAKKLRKGTAKYLLQNSIESVLTAVEVYNKPKTQFKLQSFITLIVEWAINSFLRLFPKIIGLLLIIVIFPLISLMVISAIFGATFLATFITSCIIGAFILLHFNIFDTKIDDFGLPKLDSFNLKKFIVTIFIIPIFLEHILKIYNLDIEVNNLYHYSLNLNEITLDFVKTNFINNKLLYQYLILVLPILSIALLFYIFIKLSIYWFFLGLLKYLILFFHITTAISLQI